MNLNQKEFELIEDYLLGKLDKNRKESFEKRLSDDAEFRAEVEIKREAINSIKNYGLKNELKHYHKELFGTKRNRWQWYAVAAAILLLFYFVPSTFFSPEITTKELFTENFEPFPDLITSREVDDSDLNKGMEKYSRADYKQAIIYLNLLIENNPEHEEARFYYGISHLGLGDSQSAIITFNRLNISEGKFNQQIRWYLALAFLLDNQLDKSKDQLKQIKLDEFNYQKAQRLYTQIE